MTRTTAKGGQIPEQRQGFERMTYTVKEAAQITGIPEQTLRQLARTGGLPCKRVGRRVFIRAEDLRTFINSS